MNDIETRVQDPEQREWMETAQTSEINRGRYEKRTAFASDDIGWIPGKDDWPDLAFFGATHTESNGKGRNSSEWHNYISSKPLTATELLGHAHSEWTVETMHLILDVHFKEDECRLQNRNAQQAMNIIRKIVTDAIRKYRAATDPERPFIDFMNWCRSDLELILDIVNC